MQVNLEIQSTTTANKKQSTNITYVNPEVENSILKSFAQQLIALTTNTFNSAMRITENNVDNAEKTEPTLQVSDFTSSASNKYKATINYNGDGTLYAKMSYSNMYANVENNNTELSIYSTSTTFSGTLYASEGTQYAAKSVTFQRT